MFGTILVPLDGSDLAERAIPFADFLAGLGGDDVLAMLVIDSHDSGAIESYWSYPLGAGSAVAPPAVDRAVVEERRRADAEAYLEGIKERFSQAASVETVVHSGDPASEIVEVAGKDGIGLVVMGTHGRSGIARGILGSVTDRVIRSSPVPVAAVPPEHHRGGVPSDTKQLRVIVPLDGSERSETALGPASKIAHEAGSAMTLAHFVTVESRYSGSPFNQPPPLRAGLAEVRELASKYLDSVVSRLSGEGVKAEPFIGVGYPGNQIANLVGMSPDSIVVMSSHGRRGITRWMMGSVTDSVVRTVSAPVIVVPARHG